MGKDFIAALIAVLFFALLTDRGVVNKGKYVPLFYSGKYLCIKEKLK